MKCHCCSVDKLSKEFPSKKLTEKCNHPPLHCLRCVVKCVKESHKCSQCQEPVEDRNEQYKHCLNKLAQLFPEFKEHDSIPQQPQSGSGQLFISVTLLSGDSTNIPYSPGLTVKAIKDKVQQELGPEPRKQRLLYKDKELKGLSTLQEYGVPPCATLYVVVLLYSIPDTLNHSIFDLFWGYPSMGVDFLDASALLYSGSEFVEVVDYRRRPSVAVTHSGDVMDHAKKLGHHTINVHLNQIPPHINKIFFTLSAWSSPNISKYRNPSLRFFNATEPTKQLCSDSMSHAAFSQAIIMCSLCRIEGQWQVFSLKEPSAGNAMNYTLLQSAIVKLIKRGIV